MQPLGQGTSPDDSNKDLTQETSAHEVFECPVKAVEKEEVRGEDKQLRNGGIVVDELRRHDMTVDFRIFDEILCFVEVPC